MTVHLRMHPRADEIVRRALGALLGDRDQRLHELVVGVDEVHERVAIALAHVDAHQALAPALHLPPHGLGVADQPTGETCGQLTRQRVDDLHPPAGNDLVEQLGDQRRDLRLARGDRGTGEVALHEHPLLTVPRVVLGDHVDLVGRPDRPVAHAAHEHAAAALDLLQVAVTGDAPQAVAVIAVDGLVGPHPGERRVHPFRVLVQVRVEEVEGRPIGGRAHPAIEPQCERQCRAMCRAMCRVRGACQGRVSGARVRGACRPNGSSG